MSNSSFYQSGPGSLDTNNPTVIPNTFDDACHFSDGMARVKLNDINRKCSYKDGRTGKLIIDSYWGFIDKNGNLVIPCIYPSANDFTEGLAAVQAGKFHHLPRQQGRAYRRQRIR